MDLRGDLRIEGLRVFYVSGFDFRWVVHIRLLCFTAMKLIGG